MSELKPANQNPDFGKVCIHGGLRRQCETCDLAYGLYLERCHSAALAEALTELLDCMSTINGKKDRCVHQDSFRCKNHMAMDRSREVLKRYEEMGK